MESRSNFQRSRTMWLESFSCIAADRVQLYSCQSCKSTHSLTAQPPHTASILATISLSNYTIPLLYSNVPYEPIVRSPIVVPCAPDKVHGTHRLLQAHWHLGYSSNPAIYILFTQPNIPIFPSACKISGFPPPRAPLHHKLLLLAMGPVPLQGGSHLQLSLIMRDEIPDESSWRLEARYGRLTIQ